MTRAYDMAYKVIKEIVMMSNLPVNQSDQLHDKYVVTKKDGSPVDDDAVYFVLRVDNDEDALFAAMLWAVRKNKMGLYEDLRKYSEANKNGDTISE